MERTSFLGSRSTCLHVHGRNSPRILAEQANTRRKIVGSAVLKNIETLWLAFLLGRVGLRRSWQWTVVRALGCLDAIIFHNAGCVLDLSLVTGGADRLQHWLACPYGDLI